MEHTHGGFQCGKNNQWDYNNCIPYYCDIGYSFDQYFKKCVKDCLVDWTTYFIYEDNFTNSYNINKNEKYEFILLNPNNSYYVFIDGEYTGFYVYSDELFHYGGTDTYDYGAWSAYLLTRQAIDNAINNIYDMPEESESDA